MLSLHQAHMQYPWICSRKPVMKSWTSFKILKPNPVLPRSAIIHNNRVSAPPKPKWTWTLKLWIPDPIWMFVVLQGCHSGRFTLQYILWKSSHLDSMTTSFPYLTYFPHAPEKKKPWSSWMHEYYVPKIVCLHFGSSQINGKGSIMYIPNIIKFPHIYTKIWPWVMFWKLQWV